jgi:uncharacterized protein
VVAALRETDAPAVLVSQSATGYYGARDGPPLDEHAPLGSGFLAEVVGEWERAAREAASCMGVVVIRTGVMLGYVFRQPHLEPALRDVLGTA